MKNENQKLRGEKDLLNKVNQKLREENDLLNKENQKFKEETDNLKKKLADLDLAKNQEIKKIEEKYKKLIEINTVNNLKSKLISNEVSRLL